MKKKTFIVQILDSKKPNRKSFTQVEDANFYSNDTDASLVFIPHEDTFDFQSAKVVMYNRSDESLVERDAVVTTENGRKVASYELPAEIIAHWGDWTAQPVFINGGEIYSGSIVPFSVFRYLMHDRPPRLNEVVTITRFIEQSQALVDDMVQNETQRVAQEQTRQSAEAVRIQAESERSTKYESYAQQFNDVITELSEEKDYHSLPEISGARGGHETLGARLDETTAQLAQKANQTDLEVERARITNLATLKQGSTTADAELADIRVGADGSTYQSAGESVREQIRNVDASLREDVASKLEGVTSENLYDNSIAIDGKLVVFDYTQTSILSDYADSVLNGYDPVSEGKTYTITNGNGLYIGALFFFDADKKPVCAVAQGGSRAYGSWPSIAGKVDLTYGASVTNFEILAGSNIAYAMWYITTATNSNYYGKHTGLTGITDKVQRNEGLILQEYDEYKYGEKISILAEFAESNIARINEIISGNKVKITKNQNLIQIRSAWTETHDIAVRASLNGSNNGSFNLIGYYLVPIATDVTDMVTGDLFKNAADDIAPAMFNYSYRGANHGDDRGYEITTSTDHGLTTANIGETWTDANAVNYVILKIISTTKFLVCNPLNSGFYALGLVTPVSPLTKDASTVAFSGVVRAQVLPAINHKSVKVLLPTGEEVTNGVFSADYVDIVESYDILYIPAMISYLADNIGSNTNESLASDEITDKYCTVSIIHRCTERGAITVYQSYDFVKSVGISNIGMVQSGKIGEYFCVPNTTYKDIALQVGTKAILKADFLNADKPPSRYYQYLDAVQSRGMCIGYNESFGTAKPSIRKSVLTAGQYYNTFKMYPFIIGYFNPTPPITTISNISYRVPLGTYDQDIPSVGWYYVEDDIYLLIDQHASVSKYISLPKHMQGRKVEVIEAFGTISVAEFVGANGLLVTVDTYGSTVLKLTK